MALAEKILAQTFNASDSSGHVHTVVDHHTYVFAGDGCLMEGISHEACSLAGTWQLGKLICLMTIMESRLTARSRIGSPTIRQHGFVLMGGKSLRRLMGTTRLPLKRPSQPPRRTKASPHSFAVKRASGLVRPIKKERQRVMGHPLRR